MSEPCRATGVVRVVTDSAAALDGAASDRGIRIAAMGVECDGRGLLDGELDPRAVSAAGAGRIRTSAPSPGRFLEAASAQPSSDGTVIVTVSGRFSQSRQSAEVAAKLAGRHEVAPMTVVDSGTAAGAQALVAMTAADAAASGNGLAAVAAVAREAAENVRLVGTISSLDWLAAGGHLPGVAATAGRLSGVQPIFELRQGRVRPLRPTIARERALTRLAEMFASDRPRDAAGVDVVVSHALCHDDAETLRDLVRNVAIPATVHVSDFGTAMLAHAGPGAIGLSWLWRREGALA